MHNFLILSPDDNCSVVVNQSGLKSGTKINTTKENFKLLEDIAPGHKFAIQSIRKGEYIYKYGHVIGQAKSYIAQGTHIHIHNTEMPNETTAKDFESKQISYNEFEVPTHFKGFKRNEGRAGTRNIITIVCSVNCSATVAKAVANQANILFSKQMSAKNIDKVVALTHSQGCAQAIGGLGHSTLNATLAGHIFHPNVIASLVIGLGCEGTTFKSIIDRKSEMQFYGTPQIKNFSIQDIGGTKKSIEYGINIIEELIESSPQYTREDIPLSDLCLGLNCGGSDAFSGLTANPLLGMASDLIVSQGGTVGLAEIPECHGAEEHLLSRCSKPEDKLKLENIFKWWIQNSKNNSVELNNNLAPGNISGGITTIIEKSLGAVLKAGNTPITQVTEYSEPIKKNGFTLMNTPGFDPVSVTGLVAGGSNLVAFTTGRGSTFGSAVAPTIKISTTTQLYKRMTDDIDYNAGKVLESDSMKELAVELLNEIVAIASGKETKSESLNLGQEEFVPWSRGETL